MIIDSMDLEMCSTITEILELCVDVVKKQLTDAEINDILAMGNEKEKKTIVADVLLYYLSLSAKSCLLHVYPKGDYTEDEGFVLIGSYYIVVCEYALQLVRTAMLSRSLSSNGNGSIKAISSNGRSVTFATTLDMLDQAQLPQSIKEKLPKPKKLVRVW